MNKKRNNPATGWEQAARLCGVYSDYVGKADVLLDRSVKSLGKRERQRCQSLFYTAIRHWRLVEASIAHLVPQKPKKLLYGYLAVALGELIAAEVIERPQVIDFWVGKTRQMLSQGEAGLVNAVLRRAPAWWASLEADANSLALRQSHPGWLVSRWQSHFGEAATRAFLAWNQQAAEVFLRRRDPSLSLPAGCEATEWDGFWRWNGQGDWGEITRLLEGGLLYAQDPATRLAPELLGVQRGERVLDMCAAPGGKSLLLAEALGTDAKGELICVDLPGPRLAQLDENLRKLAPQVGPLIQLVAMDALELQADKVGKFDAILLDTPCSNTGVLRRRPDAKRRLTPEQLEAVKVLQGRLLRVAISLLKPGGRLAFSTCSIEPEENAGQVESLLADYPTLRLEHGLTCYPWEAKHDGAGVYLIINDRA